MSFPWSCPHFTFEDFNHLQAFISDSIHSLREVVSKEFQPGSQLAQYDPEKPIDYHGFCLFMLAYLGENFPQTIRDKLFLSFMRRNSETEILNTSEPPPLDEVSPTLQTVHISTHMDNSSNTINISTPQNTTNNNQISPTPTGIVDSTNEPSKSTTPRPSRIHSISTSASNNCTSNLFYGFTEKLNSLGLGSVIPNNPPRSSHPPIRHLSCSAGVTLTSSKYKTLPFSTDNNSTLLEKFQGWRAKNRLGSAHSHPTLFCHAINNTEASNGNNGHNTTHCHGDASPGLYTSRSSSKKSARSMHSLFNITSTNKKFDPNMDLVLKQKSLLPHNHHHHPHHINNHHHHHHNHGKRQHSTINLQESDKIDMKDLLCYLSLLESGRPEDKLEFMFRLYDTDGNGVLDNSEVESIISQMMNVAAYLNWDTEELLPIIQEMMHEIDYDNDGEVTLEEWKRGGMTNIPLLVLLGLDTNVRDDGRHVWSQKHFTKVNHCGVCNKILVRFGRQGLCCVFCKFTVHERCVGKAPNSCMSTYTKSKKADQTLEHHWLTNHYSAKCAKCRKTTKISSTINKTGVHCRWCKRTVHKGCVDQISIICDLGENREHILPPTSIFPAVLERKATPKSKEVLLGEENRDEESGAPDNTESENSGIHQACVPAAPEQQVSSFQISPPPGSRPLLVFVNPKSGGKQGGRVLEKFQYLLNPRQVYDLMRDRGPHKGLQFFKDVAEFRILVCGGDGTVGWLLEAMDKYDWTNRPPVSILPLGTGNDLARCLKWGGGYDGENLDKILSRISQGSEVSLDRWLITCSEPAPRPLLNTSVPTVAPVTRRESKNSNSKKANLPQTNTGTSVSLGDGCSSQFDSGIREDSQVQLEDELESDVLSDDIMSGEDMPCNIINNYFSIGVDASIAHRFHTLREKHPEKFNSRIRNRMFYMEVGTSELLTATCKHLHESIDIICDGVALDLRKRGALEGIAFLNITSVYGGKNLWGSSSGGSVHHKKASIPSSNTNSDEYVTNASSNTSRFSIGGIKKKKSDSALTGAGLFTQKDSDRLSNAVQDMGDNLLEVVGLENAMHAGLVAGGFRSSGIRLAQCKEVVIRTQRCFPMQIDGEPWIQSACTISITYKNQVPMVTAPSSKKFGLKGIFSR